MRGPEDFGAAFTALLEAAGTSPDGVVRALNAAVSRNTLYDWRKGAHLPNDARLLLQVVHMCLRLAGDSADLRGAPGDAQGWLDLLAEAKQTRDNRTTAAGDRSSLRGLDQDTLGQIAGFLAGHVTSLLQMLGELAARRSPLADDLIRQLGETKGRYQTPLCVVKPKVLPAADLSVAYQHVDLLRAHRRALRELGLTDVRLLDTISALRGALEEIHGARIVFAGEKVTPKTGIRSAAPGTSLSPTDPGIDFDPRIQDPLITRVKVLPGWSRATIVVEGNPPEAMTPSGSIFDITVEARAPRAVIIEGARVVLSRQPPRRACFIKGIAGVLNVRRFDVDLDSENPQLRMQGEHDFPLTVSPGDPEEFWVQAITAANEISWTIALDWTVNGIPGTTLVNHGGSPFSLYPLDVRTGPDGQPLRTTCDHGGHEEGCPAVTLAQLGKPTSTFWSARDVNNECLFNGILTAREMGWDG